MGENTVQIRIGDRTMTAAKGPSLLEALGLEGLLLRTDCGARGRCGKCVVRVDASSAPQALSEPDELERKVLGAQGLAAGERLACRARVFRQTTVAIPAESLLTPEVVQKGPPALMHRIESLKHSRSRTIPSGFGVAVDLGTTTIAIYLCNLELCAVAASTSVRNPQAILGDDVISRICAARDDAGTLARLQHMAVSAIDWAVSALCRHARIDPLRIGAMTVVGNSIMIHLLLGEDPSSMGVFPYRPLFSEDRHLPCSRIGLTFNPDAVLHTLPLIGGYLGADIIGAALAVDLARRPPGTMLVDVGTNGEIMLVTGDGFAATSCASGPALEGAAIRHGMQATSGAISGVRFEPRTGRLDCTLIQHDAGTPKKAAGICGSGVIGTVAALLQAGAIEKSGRFSAAFESECWRRDDNGILEFEIIAAPDTLSGSPITLTQADVRALQLAKGALRAGIELLCHANGMDRPVSILLAGAFGACIRSDDAFQIGMFPALKAAEIEVVGNAAGTGAILALCDDASFARAREIARRTRIFDLAGHPGFQSTFIEHLSF